MVDFGYLLLFVLLCGYCVLSVFWLVLIEWNCVIVIYSVVFLLYLLIVLCCVCVGWLLYFRNVSGSLYWVSVGAFMGGVLVCYCWRVMCCVFIWWCVRLWFWLVGCCCLILLFGLRVVVVGFACFVMFTVSLCVFDLRILWFGVVWLIWDHVLLCCFLWGLLAFLCVLCYFDLCWWFDLLVWVKLVLRWFDCWFNGIFVWRV